MSASPHILHVFSTFGAGGAQLRMAGVINALGPAWSHSVMAMDGNFGAAYKLDSACRVELVEPPPQDGAFGRAWAFRRTLQARPPALLLTYNWGAIEAVLGGIVSRACPVIHQEHGFGPDEAVALKRRRVLARRVLLNRILGTVVPSRTLFEIALTQYRLDRGKVCLIRNGTDTERFQPRRDYAIRRQWGVADDAVLFGYVGNLRREKNLGLLLRAFHHSQAENAVLALVGSGSCNSELKILARDLGVDSRVIFAGAVEDPAPCYAAFDVFAMSSSTEQTPMALLEAMASGLPAVCTAVGDTADLLGTRESPAVVPSGDETAYAASIRELAARPDLRAALGAANRCRCTGHFSARGMVDQYAALWESAVRRPAPLFAPGTN